VRLVRIFNTYGPRMAIDDGRVVSNFIVQALQGQDITIYGDGSQTRSFCYCDDLIDGIMGLTEQDETLGPMNCGNANEFTVAELAERVLRLTGSRSRLVQKPLPQDDPKVRRPDLSLAQQLLDYKPKVELEEGLKKTIEYFRTALQQR
ncbi:MAG: GDP-mannose 4,6-dehydratase, partial [Pseudobdellovibrionaceae bacterium]|nr:GDP-mannose 4,6-dehydratase [Pseudobdellovibrionaceae bacterium]